ncbi:hypothetical protein [Mangrovibacterium marinum]|uniref:hypothetical protein n=1 Tax=Mangrovibacterium marinum TaxID=1639118 RepID=UPI0011B25555|nr:hypothetical protein [Mangrovibacterium marinum]
MSTIIGLLLLSCFLSTNIYGQEANELLAISWVKEGQSVKSGKFLFNVIRIENKSQSPLSLSLQLAAPEGSRLVTQVPDSLQIAAGTTKSVPVRLMTSKESVVDFSYQLIATASCNNRRVESSTSYTIEAERNFKLVFDSRAYAFQPDQETIEIGYTTQNEGNVPEHATIRFHPSEELALVETKQENEIDIPAYTQWSQKLKLKLKSWYRNKPLENSTVRVLVKNNETETEQLLYISKLENEYDNFSSSPKQAGNTVEYRMLASEDGNIQSIASAQGETALNEGKLIYGAHLSDFQSEIDSTFLTQNYFDLYYQTEHESFGLGTSSVSGLNQLMKRNSLFADKSVEIGSYNQIRLFGNKSINRQDYGLAAGHQLTFSGLKTRTNIGYNQDRETEATTYQLDQTTELRRQWISARYHINYENENNKLDGQEQTFLQDIDLSGLYLDKKLQFTFNNRIAKTSSDLSNQFNSDTQLNLNYLINQSGTAWSFLYSSGFQSTYTADASTWSRSRLYRSQFAFPIAARMNMYSGLQLNTLDQSSNLTSDLKGNSYGAFSSVQYHTQKFRGRAYAEIGQMHLKDGNSKLQYYLSTNADYSLSSQSQFSANVRYGNLTTLKQLETKSNQLEMRMGLTQALPGHNNSFSLMAYYKKEADQTSSPLSLKAGIDIWSKNNFNLNTSVSFKSKTGEHQFGLSAVEAKISKHFNPKNNDKLYCDYQLLFFKDDNGNNIADENEERIAGIKAILTPEAGNNRASRITALTLVSAQNGLIKYKNLPCGQYKIKYYPMVDLNGYYNFDESEFSTPLRSDNMQQIAFSKAAKIVGSITLTRSNFSSMGDISVENIRVTATSKLGKTYSALTDKFGNYMIYLPQNQTYTLTLNDIFGSKFQIKRNNSQVDCSQATEVKFDFEVSEKKRNINFGK